MSSMTEIVTAESRRLDELGIPYRFIHSCEGSPIVIVDGSTMNRVVESGISGQFVCHVDKDRWSAYYTDVEGKPCYRDFLTESRAYKMVLGYPVGRKPTCTRYAYQIPIKQRKKVRCFLFSPLS